MGIDKTKFEVSKVDGVATLSYKDDNAFYEGTDLSKAVIKQVFDHASAYIEDTATTVADVAQNIMTEDSEINNVIATVPYGVSKRGEVGVKVKREHTYKGMNGNDDVTKSTLAVAVKDPLSKLAKPKIKAMEAKLTEALLS